jgi:hypothetical protein
MNLSYIKEYIMPSIYNRKKYLQGKIYYQMERVNFRVNFKNMKDIVGYCDNNCFNELFYHIHGCSHKLCINCTFQTFKKSKCVICIINDRKNNKITKLVDELVTNVETQDIDMELGHALETSNEILQDSTEQNNILDTLLTFLDEEIPI